MELGTFQFKVGPAEKSFQTFEIGSVEDEYENEKSEVDEEEEEDDFGSCGIQESSSCDSNNDLDMASPPVAAVTFDILDNHGSDFTSIYGIRIHGIQSN